ncbi:hypothetical protein P8452_39156 [Trifolium repens]|nr:cation/H antiporter [Trifolium repens]WJX47172.1 hypothetical protein P8452_33893 [Trifolium repens]WJX53125.1 hypothetical protein P8452_39156 [Trifolium repens]
MNFTNLQANQTLFLELALLNSSLDSTTFNVCSAAPPNIVSDGFWGGQINGRVPWKSSLPMFEMQVIVTFTITQIFNLFLKRLDFPDFIGQMMAGLILGPTI